MPTMKKPSRKVRENLKPVVIRNIADIRKAIIPFIREVPENKVDIEGNVNWVDEDGRKHNTDVKSYSSDTSMRRGLLEGFEHVREQEQMWERLHGALTNDEYGAILPKADVDSLQLPVDKIIKQRLGGRREGFTVVWDLSDRRVVFDPYSKKLEEIPLE